MDGRDYALNASSFVTIPRGMPHSITRRGSQSAHLRLDAHRTALPAGTMTSSIPPGPGHRCPGLAIRLAGLLLCAAPANAQTTAIRFGELWDGSRLVKDALVIVEGDRVLRVETGGRSAYIERNLEIGPPRGQGGCAPGDGLGCRVPRCSVRTPASSAGSSRPGCRRSRRSRPRRSPAQSFSAAGSARQGATRVPRGSRGSRGQSAEDHRHAVRRRAIG